MSICIYRKENELWKDTFPIIMEIIDNYSIDIGKVSGLEFCIFLYYNLSISKTKYSRRKKYVFFTPINSKLVRKINHIGNYDEIKNLLCHKPGSSNQYLIEHFSEEELDKIQNIIK